MTASRILAGFNKQLTRLQSDFCEHDILDIILCFEIGVVAFMVAEKYNTSLGAFA